MHLPTRKGPKRLTASIRGSDVLLRWRPVAGALRYRIHARQVGRPAPRWKRQPIAVTRRHRFTHRGVTAGATYAYRVTARLRSGRLTRARRTVRVSVPAAPVGALPPAPGSGPRPHRPALPPPTRFVSPTGSDGGACTAAAPCRSFDRAYRQAAPGEVVEVAGGAYGRQSIPNAGRPAGGARVYFRAAPGASVTTGQVQVSGNGVELWEMTMSGWHVNTGTDGVAFVDVTVHGTIFITSASNVAMIGGSVGPGDSTDSQIKAANTNGAPVPTNILIDGVDFHDWTRYADPNAHIECLQFGAGVGITIRNSIFRNCETQGLFMRSWGGTAKLGNIVIENNWFDTVTDGYYPLKIGTMDGQVYENIAIRYNSGLQPFIVDPDSSRNVTWVGNFAPRQASGCGGGQTFRYNVWEGAKCGPTDRNAGLAFLDAAAMNLHLAAGSPAIDAGDPADFPARDRDGDLRVGVPDAGADER